MNATLNPHSPALDPEEILACVAAIKTVFQSAKGPKVAQLQQKVSQIEAFIQAWVARTSCTRDDNNLQLAIKLQQKCMVKIAEQMQSFQKGQGILEVTVTAVRDALKALNPNKPEAFRVLIYRFEEGNRSRVVAEANAPGWPSLLNQCLPKNVFAANFDVGEIVDLSCHHWQFWQRFQMQAGLGLPLVVKEQPWGMLVVQDCFQPRQWQEAERFLLEQVAMVLTIALHSAELLKVHCLTSRTDGEQLPQFLATPQQQLASAAHKQAAVAAVAQQHLISIQDVIAITNKQLQYLREFCQQAFGWFGSLEDLSTKMQILSLNAACHMPSGTLRECKQNKESFLEQVEVLTTQAEQTTRDIEQWLQQIQVAVTDVASALAPCDRQVSAAIESIAQIQTFPLLRAEISPASHTATD